jgi:hypothetical protein
MPLMNRIWMTLLGTLVICNSAWAGEPSPCTRLHALYPEPGSFSKRFGTALITGASVSDDFGGVRSPGRRVLEAEKCGFVKKAYPHTPSEEILGHLHSEARGKSFRSLIAIDLFFWDPEKGAKAACEPGHVEKIVRQLKRFSRFLILAKIPPELARGSSECVTLINRELESACVRGKGCFLAPPVPFDRYTGSAPPLQEDGLHLSDAGAEFASHSVCSAFIGISPRPTPGVRRRFPRDQDPDLRQ